MKRRFQVESIRDFTKARRRFHKGETSETMSSASSSFNNYPAVRESSSGNSNRWGCSEDARLCKCPKAIRGPPIVDIAFTKENFGRRFLGCPNFGYDSKGRKLGCDFFVFVDGEVFVPDHLVEYIKRGRAENRAQRKEIRRLEKKHENLEQENTQLHSQLRSNCGSERAGGGCEEGSLGEGVVQSKQDGYSIVGYCSWAAVILALLAIVFALIAKIGAVVE